MNGRDQRNRCDSKKRLCRRPSAGLVLLFFIGFVGFGSGQDFGYDGAKGPSHWGEQYNTCFGKHQSPINIDSLRVHKVKLPPLRTENFDILPNETTIENNGHTVMVKIDTGDLPTISGGPMQGKYVFSQLHFHWGENDTFGSEDLIDGQSFPMELHMVFYKKLYRTARSAMEKADGLAVLALFFQVVDEDNPKYAEFIDLLKNISEADSSVSFQQTNSFHDLLIENLDQYYTYNGSLTTPPCSEVVTWLDFIDPIPLSHEQIGVFRTIRDREGHQLTHNFRPIQPLGDRIVFHVSPDHVLDENALDRPALFEPPQGIDESASRAQHDKLQGGPHDPEQQSPADAIDQQAGDPADRDSNALDDEAAPAHPKNTKMKGKKSASNQMRVASELLLALTGISLLCNRLAHCR